MSTGHAELPRGVRIRPGVDTTLDRLLFGPTARDVDCAFKLFRRQVWERTAVHATGATFSAEFLIKARGLGYRLVS